MIRTWFCPEPNRRHLGQITHMRIRLNSYIQDGSHLSYERWMIADYGHRKGLRAQTQLRQAKRPGNPRLRRSA
jgi:hypothetical protein